MLPKAIAPPSRGGPRTFALDEALPKLPLPQLSETVETLRTRVLPPFVASREEEEELERILSGLPEELGQAQQKLQETFAERPNYVDHYWARYAYLADRSPIVPQESTASHYFDPLQEAYPGAPRVPQTLRAALVLAGVADVHHRLQTQAFPVVGSSASSPFNMLSFRYVFETCRVPGEAFDALERHFAVSDAKRTKPRTAVVGTRGRFYEIDLDDASDASRPLSVGSLMATLDRVAQLASEAEFDRDPLGPRALLDVGFFTSWDRPSWARTRRLLEQASPTNAAALDAISRAVVVLTLDDACPESSADLHHDLSLPHSRSMSAGSRWHDKAMQLIVFRNGASGFSMEHSNSDAAQPNEVLREVEMFTRAWFAQVAKAFNGSMLPAEAFARGEHARDTGAVLSPPRRLVFVAPALETDPIRVALAQARAAHEKLRTTAWRLTIRRLEKFGRKHIKTLGVSPDSFMQVALQAAYAHVRAGNAADPPSVYETVGVLTFRHGRTEAGRSVTRETKNAVAAIGTMRRLAETKQPWPPTLAPDAARVLRTACDAHSRVIRDAAAGKGTDRHLFALACMQAELGLPPPKLLSNAVYRRSSNWDLSTSHCFAELVHDERGGSTFRTWTGLEYGCVYSIQDDFCDFTVLCPHNDPEPFVGAVVSSMGLMARALSSSSSPSSSSSSSSSSTGGGGKAKM